MAVQPGADDGHGLLHHLRVDIGGATAAAAAGLTGRPGPVPRPTCPPLGVVPRADALVQDDDLRRKEGGLRKYNICEVYYHEFS